MAEPLILQLKKKTEELQEKITGQGGTGGGQGENGLSAYEIAVKNGFDGTEKEWLESLKGAPFTYDDFTSEQLEGLAGPEGKPGAKGDNGSSAYEIAVENGFNGTEEEWLESLKGDPSTYDDTEIRNELTALQNTIGQLNQSLENRLAGGE